LPSIYKDADVVLDEGDNCDDITVDKGDSIAIVLPSKIIPGTSQYEWALDTGELDDDIISHNNISEWFSGYQFWIFEAEDVGTTTIKSGIQSQLQVFKVQAELFFRR
jgi:predicted secreted protein